jgi:hypothetical protein
LNLQMRKRRDRNQAATSCCVHVATDFPKQFQRASSTLKNSMQHDCNMERNLVILRRCIGYGLQPEEFSFFHQQIFKENLLVASMSCVWLLAAESNRHYS